MANVLIIDDDAEMCRMLSDMVKSIGHDATSAFTLKAGLNEALSRPYDIVFLDVMLPDGNGLEALPKIRETASSPEVIIMTGEGSADGAEIAVQNGAWDYLEKPLSPIEILLPLKRVFQYRDNLKGIRKPVLALRADGVVGNSKQMQASFDSLAQAVSSEANVLITGETGTGKELFARAIHYNSPRAQKGFVVVDCAALPETIVESALFGHEKGAFTGADKPHEGLIKQADGGTLFLDEVGELSLDLQKAFLRVLQERRFRPIGGKQEIESNFRLVAATNREVDKMVREGRLRKDLLYRLRSVTIELPPLRQRPEDIKELVFHYMARICDNHGTETKGLSPEFFEALQVYEWPGNVRELINTLEGVISKARHEPTLFPKHLPPHVRIKLARDSVGEGKRTIPKSTPVERPALSKDHLPRYRDFRESVHMEAEKRYFKDLMAQAKGSIKEACRISGLSRTRLHTLMKRHGVSRLGWASSDSP